jgi:hypothetical protein
MRKLRKKCQERFCLHIFVYTDDHACQNLYFVCRADPNIVVVCTIKPQFILGVYSSGYEVSNYLNSNFMQYISLKTHRLSTFGKEPGIQEYILQSEQ